MIQQHFGKIQGRILLQAPFREGPDNNTEDTLQGNRID